ncbi:MAG TPA: chalcone isomerase family protein [Thermoanaerobaculia bacterium]|nr:chalcone isomerase family protein [Thermoanaerobaculia bacterium]
MKKTLLMIPLCLILMAGTLGAAEVAGVKLAEQLTLEGKTLALNGAGLRSKFFVKVYVAGLYLEKRSSDPDTILSSDQIRQVRMVMTRDLGRDKIVEAVEEGFEKNNKSRMPALRARLAQFVSVIPDLKAGDELIITYVPAKGTTLTSRSGVTVTIEGKDFGDALFSVWLGDYPVDEKLKTGMLGQSSR